jgi:uncharacterized protein YigA (DUF484 family)
MSETNPHLKALDQLQAARKRYQELEWRLKFLETVGSEKAQEPTEQQIMDWYQSLCRQHLN